MEHIHDYRKINENEDGILEVCRTCKHRLSSKKDSKTGRIDNRRYIKYHVGDTAQPEGRTGKVFKKLYGDAPKDLRYR